MKNRTHKFFERERLQRAKRAYHKRGYLSPVPYEIIKGIWVTHGKPTVSFGYEFNDFERNLVTAIVDTPVYFNSEKAVTKLLQKWKTTKELLEYAASNLHL